ncbi:MAG TPA: hypothetical protein VGS23_06935 [Thermoplasmata archaeon]|nr:hypothetical protein [Thermoplasmata archaeon]
MVLAAAILMMGTPWLAGSANANATQSSSITSGFNAQTVEAHSTIWFASVMQWVGNTPKILTHVHFVDQKLTFAAPNGTTWTVNVPAALVTYDPNATTAVTVWNSTAYRWETTVPASYTGDVFISGYAYYVASGSVPGGTHVAWSGEFQSSENCLSFNWKWAAAVYSPFAEHYADVGVKPVDSNQLSKYTNSDHAGTPENYKADLKAGARGGGGSNFTGSYSGTAGTKAGSCPGTSH